MFAHSTTHGTLLARIANPGDAEAWPEFCAKYEEMIRAFARRQGVMGANADDIVQDVLMSLSKAMPGFEYRPEKGKFRSYLKTVVVRSIYRWRERESGEARAQDVDEISRAADNDEALSVVWEEEWRQHHLRRAMRMIQAEFNAADLACFQAYVVDGEGAAEVASRMGMTTSHVYDAKYRILNRLRAVVADQIEDEG
ncbi:MAG: sigma-70 family RNA polymerase sigma factor [Planctomycetes bacterium]|nr:sigma-70 family RNA polymerase sigma factor [Planctomycetota bacterium]